MKKALSSFLALIILITSCLTFGISAFASTPYVEKTISVQQGTDAGGAIQETSYEIKRNRDKGLDSNAYKLIVPAGSYTLSDHIILFDNMYLECTGAYFKKAYNKGTMITIGFNADAATGYQYKNITVNGGTFDADGASGKKTGSIINFAHAQNVTISNVTLKNCCNGHHIGFAGCKDVTISGCTLTGHYATSNSADNNMEAIQLDILEESHFPDLDKKSYDGTMSQNITVTGCVFENVDRGIGSHSAFAGGYINNVAITSNQFKSIDGYAIITSNFTGVSITDNIIENCGSGIYYRSMIPEYTNLYAYASSPVTDNSTVIRNNNISIVQSPDKLYNQFPYGIRLYGENVKSPISINGGKLNAGDYRAQNITVEGNTINIACCAMGIWIVGAKNDVISSNTINYLSGAKASKECHGIRIESSDSITANANTVNANNVSYVKNGIITDKAKNITLSSNIISKAKDNGISINTKSQATLNSNTVSSNGQNGIFCYSNSQIKTSSNTVKNNKKHGIFFVDCSSQSTLSKDKVEANKQYGIALQKSKAKLTGESVKKNKSYGIYLTQSSSASISKCTSSSNVKEGIYVTQKSKADINGGTVASNGSNGIYFTNNAKGSVKNVKVQKNKKHGIYLTKKVGKITISKVKYSANKSGKIKK